MSGHSVITVCEGGEDASGGYHAHIWRYDNTTETWSAGTTSLAAGRSFHAVTTVKYHDYCS